MGTGGSRYGAGRPGWRRKCEYLLRLDVRHLNRNGYLRPSSYVVLQWSRTDESIATIAMHVAADGVRLNYAWTPHGADPQSMNYPVWIERTPCPYGGSRLWFRCPRCQWRRAVIYGVASDGRFGCRGCMGLAYACEAEDVFGRLWRKQRKFEGKLGENCGRPKGMRFHTYERICAVIDEIEEKKDAACYLNILALLRRGRITLSDLR